MAQDLFNFGVQAPAKPHKNTAEWSNRIRISISDLTVDLKNLRSSGDKSAVVYLMDDDEQHNLRQLPEISLGNRTKCTLEGVHEFSLPAATRYIFVKITVLTQKRKGIFSAETTVKNREYGTSLMLPADVIEPGPFWPHRMKRINLRDSLQADGGLVTFRVHIKAEPTSEPVVTDRTFRETEQRRPILSELRAAIDTLQDLETERYEAYAPCLRQISYVLHNLQRYWLSVFNSHSELEDENDGPSTAVDEYKASTGNVCDDLVKQLGSHLKCLHEEVLPVIARSSDLQAKVEEPMRELLRNILRTSMVLFSCARLYPETSYDQFSHSQDPIMRDTMQLVDKFMEDTVVRRCQIITTVYPDRFRDSRGKVQTTTSANFATVLYNVALSEVTQGLTRLAANTLYSLRGESALKAINFIQSELRTALGEETPKRRDALRRMLTHLAQESNTLPHSLVVPVTPEKHAVDAGAFGTIDTGKLRGTTVAMKAIRIYPRTGNTLNQLRQMYLEVLTCQSLTSPRIIKLYGIAEANGMSWIVMPYFSRGNARMYLDKVWESPIHQNGGLVSLVHNWFHELADGMEYLHHEGIAHGDIRGVNLLVNSSESIVIADFGLTVFADAQSKQYLSRRSGSIQWSAPEIIGESASTSTRPTRESDVYAFSHVCVELYTRQLPYHFIGENIKDSYFRQLVFEQGVRPPTPTMYDLRKAWPMDERLYGLLQECWHQNPAVRPQIAAVKARLETLLY